MSIVFVPSNQKSESGLTSATVQKMLEENTQLIQTIYEFQLKGRMTECVEYQKVLHRNIVYLARLSDLSSSCQVSLPGTQIGSVSGSHVTQMHTSGQDGSLGTVTSQSCQQGNEHQVLNTSGHQSIMSLNQPLISTEHPGNYGQMSQGCIVQGSNLMMPQQQLMMSQEQPVLLHHPTTMANNSYSLTSLHESNQLMLVQPISHQEVYHSSATDQQEYTQQQQFSGHLIQLPQYTQLMPNSSTLQNQCMSNIVVQESLHSYVSYSSQIIMNSEDITHQHQNNNMAGAKNQAEQAGQQGSVLGNVRELTGDMNFKQADVTNDRNLTHYNMPNLTDG